MSLLQNTKLQIILHKGNTIFILTKPKYRRRLCLYAVLTCIMNPLYANQIERVNVSSTGEQSNNNSLDPKTSADGQVVVYMSHADNLIEGDTNNQPDVFLYDRNTNVTERISISSSGVQADRDSGKPDVSHDGRIVVFESQAHNLIDSINLGFSNNIFLHDRNTGTTELVSRTRFGLEADGRSNAPSISGNGRFVAFESRATDLVSFDTNNLKDIFVYDRQTQVIERVSVSTAGAQADNESQFPKISQDGRYVVFRSRSSNLVNGTAVGPVGLYIHDRSTGITDVAVTDLTGSSADFYQFDLSADGRYIAFRSQSTNLIPEDTDIFTDILVYDHVTKDISLASVSSTGEKGNSTIGSGFPAISGDGRYVTFSSGASNLVDQVVGGINTQVFVHDRHTGKTALVSVTQTGVISNSATNEKHITPDGRFITIRTDSRNLVEGDTNRNSDIFVKDNPLTDSDNLALEVEKPINNIPRVDFGSAAQLATGSLHREFYTVTNNTPHRLYQVKVYEGNTVVCDFFVLEPGQSRTRCYSNKTVLEGEQRDFVRINARVTGTAELLTNYTNAYYTGVSNATAQMRVNHYINNKNADTPNQAVNVNSQPATVFFSVENTGDIELYRVRAYHDPISPVNSGWAEQCKIGPIRPAQTRYCRRDIMLPNTGLNHVIGRAQGVNAFVTPTGVINAENPTYFNVP